MIITVGTGKGGTGKTTTALGLAATWAEAGKRVLVADLDPQDAGSATWWLDQREPDLMDWTKATGRTLAKYIKTIDADVVVIDTPPRLDGPDLPKAIELSDLAVFVSEPSALDISATAQTIATAVDGTPYTVCLTKVDPRSMAEAHQGRLDLLELGHPVSPALIRRYAIARRAAPSRLPTELPGAEGTNHKADLRALATDIEQRLGA